MRLRPPRRSNRRGPARLTFRVAKEVERSIDDLLGLVSVLFGQLRSLSPKEVLQPRSFKGLMMQVIQGIYGIVDVVFSPETKPKKGVVRMEVSRPNIIVERRK